MSEFVWASVDPVHRKVDIYPNAIVPNTELVNLIADFIKTVKQ